LTDHDDTHKRGDKATARRVSEALDGYPLAVLAGGLAIGALAGAVLPRTERESELLGPIGKRLTDGATAAARAARDAGKAELDEAGVSRDAARAQINRLIDGVLSAAGSAGEAAAKAAMDKS
jgi:hypothetical protein